MFSYIENWWSVKSIKRKVWCHYARDWYSYSIGISEDEYYWGLSTSLDSDIDLHLKRPVDSCFINIYFVAGVKGFAANVDLQPVDVITTNV